MADLKFIENEGQLYRGPSRANPLQVWNAREKQFVPYSGGIPKGVDWGEIIDADAAAEIMNA